VHEVEVLRPADTDPDNRLNALPLRLGNKLLVVGLPALKMLAHLGKETVGSSPSVASLVKPHAGSRPK
jgi:hypothetical protein